MTSITPLFPRRAVPQLEVTTVEGERWSLSDRRPRSFTLISVYRGLHCPICSRYLADLQSQLDTLEELGVDAIAVSSDGAERARDAKTRWKLDRLTVGYGLDLDTARRWGLYVSAGHGKTSAGVEEPPLFVEPGLFLVRPDGTLYFASVQTMPFARPRFDEVVQAIRFVLDKGYPARGEVIDHHAHGRAAE